MRNSEGELVNQDKGTPQGGVISPLLANLYLHYCMDEWLRINYPQNPFERYADDSVVHCRTEKEAQELRDALVRLLVGVSPKKQPKRSRRRIWFAQAGGL